MLSKSVVFVRSEMLYEVLERRIKNRYIQRCPVTTEVKEHELKSSGVMTKVSEHRCECRGVPKVNGLTCYKLHNCRIWVRSNTSG